MNDDRVPALGSIATRRGRAIALRENSLVARGLRDIAKIDGAREPSSDASRDLAKLLEVVAPAIPPLDRNQVKLAVDAIIEYVKGGQYTFADMVDLLASEEGIGKSETLRLAPYLEKAWEAVRAKLKPGLMDPADSIERRLTGVSLNRATPRDWPIQTLGPPRAWCPCHGPLSVPLYPKDKVLTKEEYWDRMAERFRWMVENCREEGQDPEEVLGDLWWNQVGNYLDLDMEGGLENFVQSVAFQELALTYHGLNEVEFLAKVEFQPAAVDEIQEMWNLEEWLIALLPDGH